MEQSFFISFPNRKASLEHSVASSTLKYQKKKALPSLSVCLWELYTFTECNLQQN
jgi:hypothetical protein